jgi:hypothetical protein
MLGDKAYDSAELREDLHERGTKPVIPNRCNREQPFSFSKRIYRLRWLIESAFNRLKDFTRIATRYDRSSRYCEWNPNGDSAAIVKRTVAWLRVLSVTERQVLFASSSDANGPKAHSVPPIKRSKVMDSYLPPTTQKWRFVACSFVISDISCLLLSLIFTPQRPDGIAMLRLIRSLPWCTRWRRSPPG